MRIHLIAGVAAFFVAFISGTLSTQPVNDGNATPQNAGAGVDRPFSLYDAIPRTAGIKTLIDFNDYEPIISSTRGYVAGRYLPENDPSGIVGVPGDPSAQAAKVGRIPGMPVLGYPLDPAHRGKGDGELADREVDFNEQRGVTVVGTFFPKSDVSRGYDHYEYGGYSSAATSGPSSLGGVVPKNSIGAIEYSITADDLSLDSWLIRLNSSADSVNSRRFSYAKKVTSYAKREDGNYKDYLGARIQFPTRDSNASAVIAPAYPLPAFDLRGFPINYGFFDPDVVKAGFDVFGASSAATGDAPQAQSTAPPSHGTMIQALAAMEGVGDDATAQLYRDVSYNGVLHNVGEIRSISVTVSGRQHDHGLALRLRDQDNNVREYFVGYLDFVGWRSLRWINPEYLPARDMEPFDLPLYPTEIPYQVFDSFVIYRDAADEGGDFVVYFDNVKLDYDLAVPAPQLESTSIDLINIDDDSWWYIMRDRNQDRTESLLRKFNDEIDSLRQSLGRETRSTANQNLPIESDSGGISFRDDATSPTAGAQSAPAAVAEAP